MDIPNFLEFLEFFDFLRGPLAGYIILLTSALIFVVQDWRWSVSALAIQYLIVGLLFAEVLEPRLAFMKVLVGIFICIILYFTARQINWGKLPVDVTADEAVQLREERLLRLGPYSLPTDTPFRVFFALMMVLVIWTLSQRPVFQLPIVPEHFNLVFFALVGFGLLNLSFTTEPFKAGIGLLTLFCGFELFYSGLEQSVMMLAFLAAANLTMAVAASYLIQARHAYQALMD